MSSRSLSAMRSTTGAEASGDWLIEQAADEAFLVGAPLTKEEIAFLRKPVSELTPEDRPFGFALNNKLVPLIRQRIERSKAMGRPTIKVRRGLRLPVEWQNHYGNIFVSELPWLISGVMQCVMLGNPMAGESKPWNSR